MANTADKIQTPENLLNRINDWKKAGEKIVFTNGCFDLLHAGHVEYLEKSAQKGTKLIVGLNTDNSISRIKGPKRPLVGLQARAKVIAALGFVAGVTWFDTDTPLDLITLLKPDILTKGADYTIENIIGSDFVLEHGGQVLTVDLVEGFSSTNLINKIVAAYS